MELTAIKSFLGILIALVIVDDSVTQETQSKCISSYGQTSFRCNFQFIEKDIVLSARLHKCKSPISLTVTLDIYDLGIHLKKAVSHHQEIPIPGFEYTKVTIKAGIYLGVELNKRSNYLYLKMTMYPKLTVGDASIGEKMKILLLDEQIAEINECGAFGWFSNLPSEVKIAIIAGGVVAFLVLICGIACCLCYCKRKTSAQAQFLYAQDPMNSYPLPVVTMTN